MRYQHQQQNDNKVIQHRNRNLLAHADLPLTCSIGDIWDASKTVRCCRGLNIVEPSCLLGLNLNVLRSPVYAPRGSGRKVLFIRCIIVLPSPPLFPLPPSPPPDPLPTASTTPAPSPPPFRPPFFPVPIPGEAGTLSSAAPIAAPDGGGTPAGGGAPDPPPTPPPPVVRDPVVWTW